MASNSIGLINEANFISSGEQERYQHFSFLSLEVSFGSLRERDDKREEFLYTIPLTIEIISFSFLYLDSSRVSLLVSLHHFCNVGSKHKR